MKSVDIHLNVRYRPNASESIERRHEEVSKNMRAIDQPLGWTGLSVPPAPDCGENLSAHYSIRYPTPGIDFIGSYSFRDEDYLSRDEASYDDSIEYRFKNSNRHLDYQAILHEHLPKVVRAFPAYRLSVSFGVHEVYYCGGVRYENQIYNRLRSDPVIDLNGRNNIFTLQPAMYWDAQLCQRALGYGRDEVIRRLESRVPKVMPLMDGVYTVFNDDPNLSYEEFVAINDKFKPILGLE